MRSTRGRTIPSPLRSTMKETSGNAVTASSRLGISTPVPRNG